MNVVINSCLDKAPDDSQPLPYHGHYYQNILTCLGYPIFEPPVADLLRRLHDLDGTWLIVSPLHWLATHNDAMLVAAGDDLQLTDSEGKAWFDAFAEFVLGENMQAYYHDATTWLLRINKQPVPIAKPVHALLHQSMMPAFDTLDKTFYWQRFITENQMFLSGHRLNKLRQDRYPINGIWVWGSGLLQTPHHQTILLDDHETLPLAKLLSTSIILYESNQTYPSDALVLWHDLSRLDELQATLNKQTVSWYWNNRAYLMKREHWLKRIWR